MSKRLLTFILVLCSFAFTAGVATANEAAEMPSAQANIHNPAALRHGAKLFFNYCVGCHSLKYVRYSRMAADLGLSEAEVMNNLNFTGAKFAGHVVSAMPEADAAQWFGKAPPDLSLEVNAKGADWVYNYLRSFYIDPSRPVGWNNTVFPNASMPNVLWSLQGIQTAVRAPSDDGKPGEVEKLTLSQPGRLTAAQFDADISDLVSFLKYASEPAALKRTSMGVWVLLYLGFFTLLAYMLKREFWKDVH